jgi:hypothetical protein
MGENLKLKGKMHNILCFVRKKRRLQARAKNLSDWAWNFRDKPGGRRLKIVLRLSSLSRV